MLQNKLLNKKIGLIALTGVILVEAFSLLGHFSPTIGSVSFFVILVLTIGVSILKLEWGILILLAELFIGSQGRLFSIEGFSIRMGIFVIITAMWIISRVKAKNFKLTVHPNLYNYFLLAIFIALGFVQGIIRNNQDNLFSDFNAWLFFILVLPFFDIAKSKTFFKNALSVLITTTTWLSLKTIILLILFSNAVIKIGDPVYSWIRDTRTGEITYLDGSLFRIFFQSQIFILIGFLIILTLTIANWQKISRNLKIKSILYLYITSLAIIISQSRSFWIGGIIALISLIIVSLWKFKIKFLKLAISLTIVSAIIISHNFAIKILTNNLDNTIGNRFDNLQAEAGSASRLNQLEPLTSSIGEHFILGHGFGKTLTYVSTDPRVVENNSDGIYTTYAFEWGYLDIILKIGIVGFLVYGFLVFKIFKNNLENNPIKIGLLIGLVGLIITNIFSPYLNHPLGIGYIMLVSMLLLNDNNNL